MGRISIDKLRQLNINYTVHGGDLSLVNNDFASEKYEGDETVISFEGLPYAQLAVEVEEFGNLVLLLYPEEFASCDENVLKLFEKLNAEPIELSHSNMVLLMHKYPSMHSDDLLAIMGYYQTDGCTDIYESDESIETIFWDTPF